MNAAERVAAAVAFRPTDRVPVVAQVFGHAAVLAGVPLGEYVRDGATLARCQLAALDHYGYDAVFATMDVSVETEALGASLRYDRDRYPIVERYPLTVNGDWDDAVLPDPHAARRMPELLTAVGILRRELRDEVLVVGCVTGPFTLATQLLGMEQTLYLAVDDPQRLEQLMDLATDVIVRFGVAQIEAGAHLPVVFDPSASPAVVPPQFFREFELPRLRRVFDAFAEAGASANWLHIAGPTKEILRHYPEAGVDLADFDYCVSAEDASAELPRTCLDGNIRPLAFVDGEPADIAAAADALLRAFEERGGFILSSGCEIPPESSPANVAALVAAVRRAG
jgi:uroporphyrinogen decarboxylase